MSFVVRFGEDWTVGVVLSEVDVVGLRLVRGEATLLTHVHLVPPLFVLVLILGVVDLPAVRLQGTPLGERLVTVQAPVRLHSCT